MSCAETAEAINLPFGLWTRAGAGRRKHKFNCICHVAPMCPHGRAYWRHLANTIEPPVCGGAAVLRQITLTMYYIYDRLLANTNVIASICALNLLIKF